MESPYIECTVLLDTEIKNRINLEPAHKLMSFLMNNEDTCDKDTPFIEDCLSQIFGETSILNQVDYVPYDINLWTELPNSNYYLVCRFDFENYELHIKALCNLTDYEKACQKMEQEHLTSIIIQKKLV